MITYSRYGSPDALYASPSSYSNHQQAAPLDYIHLLDESNRRTPFSFEKDGETLALLLTPVSLSEDASIATQLFGGQGRQLKLSLEHHLNLLRERAQLHKSLIADIDHTNMKFQERLFGAQLHGRLDGYKTALNIEKVLAQLDEQKRREELQFWKDSMEIREHLFEHAGNYHALRQRMDLFRDLAPVGGSYV